MGVSYLLVKNYKPEFSLLIPIGAQYVDPLSGNVHWGRPILLEVTLTAVMTMVYLILFYDAGLSVKVDRVLKGIVMLFATQLCFMLS